MDIPLKVTTGSNALEVLGRSPGVMVDQSENIRMKGKPAVTVMIDGKPAPVQGTDLANTSSALLPVFTILLATFPASSGRYRSF